MPFLRLTRDRRGFENTFLLHADHPGAKPRLLYWYRTAPGIALGRPPLDEDAIRTIEENHPDIEFDWPAILALSEVMTPEEEPAFAPKDRDRSAPARRRRREPREDRDDFSRGTLEQSADGDVLAPMDTSEVAEPSERLETSEPPGSGVGSGGGSPEPVRSSLVDDLAGREVARALRARYAEIKSKIDRREGDRDPWLARAEAINPDAWLTPEAVLQGVTHAGEAYEKLKRELD